MSLEQSGHPYVGGMRSRNWILIPLVIALLLGLPVAAWLDLRSITDSLVQRQATDMDSVITGIRGYYTNNVVQRVKDNKGSKTILEHDYKSFPGAIPIPATLSLELGEVIKDKQSNVTYSFISDYPFKNRPSHNLDKFEKDSLQKLRESRNPDQRIKTSSWSPLESRVRQVTPVIMTSTCVECHNSHPLSPKTDWKVGDVRGIQEVSISQPIGTSIFAFKYLLLYLVVSALAAFLFISMQFRQAAALQTVNLELESANDFLASISTKISRYLSPQVYKSIFSGAHDGAISTKRKRLTIFFSDIKDFTATTESSQPESITHLLNEYFTEMSEIALKHGGTIDKFIGDAILIFFGDPESRGEAADARACLQMAFEMQSRVAEMNVKWRSEGVDKPFLVRIGINTGFCNVGNFGSDTRMDYTIIGAEANLAARLQTLADPGRIVLGPETCALVREIVSARALPSITMKGISKEVTPYLVEGLRDAEGGSLFTEHSSGFTFYLDLNTVDASAAEHVRTVLQNAADAIGAAKKQTEIGITEWQN